MNIYSLGNKVFRFKIYNLNYKEISGHYTIWLNYSTKKFLIAKHGDFANLVSYVLVDELPREPLPEEKSILEPIVEKEISSATFYVNGVWWNKRPFLDKKLNQRRRDGDYFTSSNTIFKVDYSLEADKTRDKDSLALKALLV